METNRESSVFGAKKQDCVAVVKITQLWLRSFSFHEHSSGICLFPNINILMVLLCLKLKGKNLIKYIKLKEYTKLV